MKLWIDITTGTWGRLDDIRVVDIADVTAEHFDELTDEGRCKVGRLGGIRVPANNPTPPYIGRNLEGISGY